MSNMRAVVSRDELLKELQLCSAIVEKRSTIPILNNLLLTVEGDQLLITATDLDITVGTSCIASIPIEGSVTIEADRLLQIVRTSPDKTVTLEAYAGGIEIASGGSRFKVATLPAGDFPTLPTMSGSQSRVTLSMAEFATAIRASGFAIDATETRFSLQGAVLSVAKGEVELYSTDGHRLPVCRMRARDGASLDKSLLPVKALRALSKVDGEEATLTTAEGQLAVQIGARTFLIRQPGFSTPNVNEVLPRKWEASTIVDREQLRNAIQRALIGARDTRSKMLVFGFDPQLLTIGARDEQTESIQTLSIEYAGDPITIGMNGMYVNEYLAAIDSEKVEISLISEHSPMRVTPSPALCVESFYIVMPMRVEKRVAAA